MNNDLNVLKEQHISNYKYVILEYIKSNSISLFDEDIKSLFIKPPLDSMDIINNKILGLAKKNNIILNTEKINKILDLYRNNVVKKLDSLKKERINYYVSIVDKVEFDKDNSTIKILKKDVNSFDKKLKSNLKELITFSTNKYIIDNLNDVFSKDVDSDLINSISLELSKFLLGSYIKQILDNIDIKILVKDTLLINSCKEETDRYLYTVENSYLFN